MRCAPMPMSALMSSCPICHAGYGRQCDFLALALTAFLSWLFSWKIWVLMVDSLQTGIKSSTYLLTPLWVPQGILWVGFTLLA